MRKSMTLGFLVLFMAAPAVAKEDRDGALAAAKRLAKDGKYVEAVTSLAAELAAAQKKKDFERQLRVWDVLDDRAFLRVSTRGQEETYIECLEVLLKTLDPKTTNAACSAGQVAHALLYAATRTGKMDKVSAAAKVAVAYGKLKTGKHAKLMAQYGKALELVAVGKAAEVCPDLSAALETAVEEEWNYVAVHLATEAAAAHLAAGSERDATAALASGKKALDQAKDRAVWQFWRDMVKVRLSEASEAVLAPFEEAREAHGGAGSVGAAGGAGGSARPRGAQSKLGAAWKRLSKKKPFVQVQRTGTGFRMTESFDKNFAQEKEYGTGVKYMDDGGITLGFFDRSVTLAMLDMVGNAGAPGESSQPGPFQFFTPLGEDETWGVTKTGAIVVK